MVKVKFTVTLLLLSLSLWWSATAAAQGTGFTYQGKLVDNGNLANGNYDFQFKLFDTQTVGTGNQVGSLVPASNVTVTNGIFTVQLDFGTCPACFDGSARFLEIALKPTSGSTFTTLGPRQPLTSNPYAIRSLNAANATTADGLSVACVNCVTSSQIQSVNGSAVSGTIPVASVPAGSTNYIQNGTSQQAASNFNISGTGTATILNAATQFNLGNSRVLSAAGSGNLFAGSGAGASNTGSFNAFFGAGAGSFNTTGSFNAFFGLSAGNSNTFGTGNAFFGERAGNQNTGGSNNTFIGRGTDFTSVNPTGDNNTLLGSAATVTSGVSNGTAIGSGAQVTQSNSLVLGNNVNVGIGTTAPTSRLHVVGNGLFTGNLTVNGTLTASLPAGSANYIQNQTAASQIGDFNISGNGTVGGTLAANIVNAARYDINGQKVLSVVVGADCLYVGFNAGSNGSCEGHSFVGTGTGSSNTSGFHNSYFGSFAGNANTSGANNAFFGYLAGRRNTSGASNAFFGSVAGFKNTVGQNNTFIGEEADFNVFDPTGDNNTLLGFNANVNSGVNNGTAIGANASVTQSNSLILGSINGVNSATADTKVGIGTTTPGALLDVQRDGGTIPETARFTTFGTSNLILGRSSNGTRAAPAATPIGRVLLQLGATGHDGTDFATTARASIQLIASEDWTPTALGTNIRFLTTANGTVTTSTRLFIRDDGNVGIGTTAPLDKLDVNGDIRVGTGTNGCVKDSDGTVIAGTACSSDARFKRDIVPFPHLLDKLVRLQPVHFFWRNEEFKERHFGSSKSFGLIAQEVEKVLPELVSEDVQGYKAVNYSKLPLLSLQAIKELKAENDTLKQKLSEQQGQLALQQQQLSQQQQQISQQQQEMAAVKKLLCQSQPQADLCKAKSVH